MRRKPVDNPTTDDARHVWRHVLVAVIVINFATLALLTVRETWTPMRLTIYSINWLLAVGVAVAWREGFGGTTAADEVKG